MSAYERKGSTYYVQLLHAEDEIQSLRAALSKVAELCDQNDGGLNQAHLVQLVEYIRVAAKGGEA